MTRITIIFLVACLTLMARETREAIANPKSIVQAEAKSTIVHSSIKIYTINYSYATNDFMFITT